MNIQVKNHSYSKRKENHAKATFEKFANRILGKDNSKNIKTLQIRLMTNFGKQHNAFREDIPFSHIWDEKTGTALLAVAPNWMKNLDRLQYGIKHEMVHLRDVMNGWIVAEKPKKNEKMRVWYLNDSNEYELYTRHAPVWLLDELWDNAPYDSWLDAIGTYYPWERVALTVDKWCK